MYRKIIEELDSKDVSLVAVSKTKPNSQILELYNLGQRIFGENRVQELLEKHETLPNDIEWHLIGHLQSNKVKYVAPFVAMIHAVDSYKLLKEINAQANKNERIIDVLLQIKIASEDSKFGLDELNYFGLLKKLQEFPMDNIRIRGLMGMATFTDDMKQVRKEFAYLKMIFEKTKASNLLDVHFDQISMGMSGDYKVAIEEGSTMVRIGSLLFGAR